MCAVPLAGGTQNIQLLEQIVSDQRGLLMQVFNTTDVTTIPQVWTLCKSWHSNVPRYALTEIALGDRQGSRRLLRRWYASARRRYPLVV